MLIDRLSSMFIVLCPSLIDALVELHKAPVLAAYDRAKVTTCNKCWSRPHEPNSSPGIEIAKSVEAALNGHCENGRLLTEPAADLGEGRKAIAGELQVRAMQLLSAKYGPERANLPPAVSKNERERQAQVSVAIDALQKQLDHVPHATFSLRIMERAALAGTTTEGRLYGLGLMRSLVDAVKRVLDDLQVGVDNDRVAVAFLDLVAERPDVVENSVTADRGVTNRARVPAFPGKDCGADAWSTWAQEAVPAAFTSAHFRKLLMERAGAATANAAQDKAAAASTVRYSRQLLAIDAGCRLTFVDC
jgi:hypothetical protein